MVRMGFTPMTCPNVVGSLMSVPTVVHWEVLRRLIALICNVSARLPLNRMSRTSVPFSWCPPGPVMRLRDESPYAPAPGTANAEALKKFRIFGSDEAIGVPVTFARSEQLVPCAMSVVAPHTRAENGVPDCAVNVNVADQPPIVLARTPLLSSQRRPWPNGSSASTVPVNCWRRSKFDGAHSASGLRGSCATMLPAEPSDGVSSIDFD